jgi:hypothetical protein
VLFGDSHAIQWFNAVREIAAGHHWKLVTVLKSGCPATDITPPGMDQRAGANCFAWRQAAIKTIVSLHPALTIVGSATTYLRSQGRVRGISVEKWRSGTRRTLRALAQTGAPIAILRDVPRPPVDIPNCLARAVRHSWYRRKMCDFDEAAALPAAVYRAERQAAANLTGVTFVDMTDQICDDGRCRAREHGLIVYRDDNHLTGTFAGNLAGILAARLPVF